ncbi:MAG: CoA transferase [Actinomycetota bacterium]|nr:CoA transferase [Actinomycetota bacterium]
MRAPGASPPPTNRPLADLRVLDLTDVRGDLCGRLLADLGADVLRIEPPEGAGSRRRPPFAPTPAGPSGDEDRQGMSLHFAVRNTNKRSAVLDLETAGGRDRLIALAAEADVLVESYQPGHLATLGVGPEDLLAVNSELVFASLSGLGHTGPDRHLEVTDDVLFGLSGWLHLSGIPGKPPLLIPGALASDTVGVAGTLAVLVGLVHRARGGGGQHLDVSALEALAQMNTWGIANASDTVNRASLPPAVRSGDSPMYPTVECADGKVRLVVIAPGQWRALWEWMGSPEAFADEYWDSFFNRLMNLDVLNPLYAEHWSGLTMVEGCREAQNRGIVATPLLSPSDVLADEHFASRGTFLRTEVMPGPDDRPLTGSLVSGAMEIDGHRVGHRVRAPELGEHEAGFAGPRFRFESSLPALLRPDRDRRPETHRGLPLEGLRVADFGHGGVGVECSRILAEYGADTVKVESHAYPDFIRIVLGGEMTASFASSSRNKRCLGLDLKNPDALEVTDRLLDWADVVVENNSTGTMDRLGLGWESLRLRKASMVMVSSQLMGSRGLQADWSGYGPTLQTAGGLSWLWAFDDDEGPPGSNAIHPDHLAGRISAIGALAALIGRDRGAPGAHVEVAQVEALMATLADLFLSESLSPGSARPRGNDSPEGAPWGVYPCEGEERWAVVCVRDDADWTGLQRAMGDPDWARAPSYDHFTGRDVARREIDERIAEWTLGLSPAEVQELCQAEGVPAGRVMSTLEQLDDPHLAARGFLAEIAQQGLSGATTTFEGSCFTGTAMARPRQEPAPMIGEHTRVFCSEDLGMDPARIESLLQSGALEQYEASRILGST